MAGLANTYKLDIDKLDIVIGDATFTCKHLDTSSVEYTKIAQRKGKPYRAQSRNGNLSVEQDRRLAIEVFVECCLVGWSGVKIEDDDPEIPYSTEAAVDLFVCMPRLFSDVAAEAADMSRFRKTELAAIAKN